MKQAHTSSFLVLLMMTLVLACGQAPEQAAAGDKPSSGGEPPAPKVKAVPVAVAAVEVGPARSFYATTATIEAQSHAVVMSRTDGVVRDILVEEGDQVEKGQTLLVMEDEQEKLAVKQARLELERVQLSHQRTVKMKKLGVLSDQEYDESGNALASAEAALEVAELNLSFTRVIAPFEGVIVRRLVDLGDHIGNNVELFQMMDVTPLLLRIHIPANRMGNLEVGQNLSLTLDSTGEEVTGEIHLISPIVNPDTGTVKVTARLTDYPPSTRPGDFTAVRIVTERRENALLVPSIAVFEEQGRSVLFTVVDGKAVQHQVKSGFVMDGVTEIREGLTADAMVVVRGQRNLRDGIPVEISEESEGEASGEEVL